MKSFNQSVTALGVLLFIIGIGPVDASAQKDRTAADSSAYDETLKRKATARGLSFVATLVSVGIGAQSLADLRWQPGSTIAGGGLLFGPSVGLLYAEDSDRALRGIGIRMGIGAGTALLTVAGVSVAASVEDSWAGLGVLASGIIVGTLSIFAHAIRDAFIATGHAVEEHNEAVRQHATGEERTSFSVGPWTSPHDGRPGLTIRVSL